MQTRALHWVQISEIQAQGASAWCANVGQTSIAWPMLPMSTVYRYPPVHELSLTSTVELTHTRTGTKPRRVCRLQKGDDCVDCKRVTIYTAVDHVNFVRVHASGVYA